MIKKYSDFINESLLMTDGFLEILNYLSNTKGDRVASILMYCRGLYEDDNDINFVGLNKEFNMISFLPKNRRIDDHNANINSDKKTPVRVGRAVGQILTQIKKSLCLDFKGEEVEVRMYGTKRLSANFFINSSPVLYTRSSRFLPASESVLKLKIGDKELVTKVSAMGTYSDKVLQVQFIIEDGEFIKEINKTSKDCGWRNKIANMNIELSVKNDFTVTPSDIEKFTNEFISAVKMTRADVDSKIEVVKGNDISFWYNSENYQSTMGKLGGSCMSNSEAAENYLDIYTTNTNKVSLLILKNKENKLVGRALLWKLDDGRLFMDRIYTASDSDDNIFVNYAIENEYIYRNTPAGGYIYLHKGKEIDPGTLTVKLDDYDFDNYPYLDTLRFLSSEGVLSNINSNTWRTLVDTDGRWNEYDEDD